MTVAKVAPDELITAAWRDHAEGRLEQLERPTLAAWLWSAGNVAPAPNASWWRYMGNTLTFHPDTGRDGYQRIDFTYLYETLRGPRIDGIACAFASAERPPWPGGEPCISVSWPTTDGTKLGMYAWHESGVPWTGNCAVSFSILYWSNPPGTRLEDLAPGPERPQTPPPAYGGNEPMTAEEAAT